MPRPDLLLCCAQTHSEPGEVKFSGAAAPFAFLTLSSSFFFSDFCCFLQTFVHPRKCTLLLWPFVRSNGTNLLRLSSKPRYTFLQMAQVAPHHKLGDRNSIRLIGYGQNLGGI
jgi:hypothetical protein